MDSKAQLINTGLRGVDDNPTNKLGTIAFTETGDVAKYVKTTAKLTAGTAVGVAKIVPASLTCTQDGAVNIASTTPAVSTLKDGDLDGLLLKITHKEGSKIEVLPISGSRKVENKFVVSVPGVKAGDTVADAGIGGATLAGGSTAPGAIQAVSLAEIPSGKYGWVIMGRNSSPGK